MVVRISDIEAFFISNNSISNTVWNLSCEKDNSRKIMRSNFWDLCKMIKGPKPPWRCHCAPVPFTPPPLVIRANELLGMFYLQLLGCMFPTSSVVFVSLDSCMMCHDKPELKDFKISRPGFSFAHCIRRHFLKVPIRNKSKEPLWRHQNEIKRRWRDNSAAIING